MTIPHITVSLSGGETHFCRAGITLHISKKNYRQIKQKKYITFIQDTISDVLSSYRAHRLLTHEGKMRLKRHIRTNINRDFLAPVVQDVHFREFILE